MEEIESNISPTYEEIRNELKKTLKRDRTDRNFDNRKPIHFEEPTEGI